MSEIKQKHIFLRDVDPVLHREFKMACAKQDKSMRTVLLNLIDGFIKQFEGKKNE